MSFDIILFIISMFLQGFAVIKTNGFGISLSLIIIIYIIIKYKILNYKVLYKTIALNFFILIILLIGYFFNDELNILKILRLEMLIVISFGTINFLYILKQSDNLYKFLNYLSNITIIMCFYGYYELIAYNRGFPIFLNIFRNNPSYGLQVNFYDYYNGGWIQNRIYGTFTEPSFYASFLIALLLIFLISDINKKRKFITILFILTNIILARSRSGYSELLILLILYFLYYIFRKFKFIKISIFIISFFIPILNILIMRIVNLFIFNDLSSATRTSSVLYYTKGIFENFSTVFFGHGLGSMQKNFIIVSSFNSYVEQNAHNGYIELLYETGIILFLLLLIYLIINLNNKNTIYEYFALSYIFITCMFGTSFYIESILQAIIIVTYFFKIKTYNI
ncbi:O-antigen ligase family protein [Clostridium perfringens]|uniref:O-antigen ligase family protein n=1 Tax=Clostridium perfringens TaxID=1502 RepID=UPI001ABB747F|nr:O-antigen ligase family protein [Clostridium perfringens]MBO3314139.1 O-antigen ligase family protein [Clostridium perfringens]